MPPVKDVSRIERESSLLFGLKWSFVGFAIALSFLAGCSSLFDHGPDRYNVVSGPRRPPPMNPGTMGAGQGTQSFHVPSSGYQQQQQPMYPQQGMQQPQMGGQMGGQYGQAYPQGQTPYDTMHGEMESESWWDGWFDWFGDDDEVYQTPPAAYAGYGAPAAQPVMPPRMAQYQQPAPMMQQPQMAMPAPAPAYVPPMPTPQQAVPQQPAPIAQPSPMLQPRMPQPAPVMPQTQANMRSSVEAQIAELERELAESERRRQQVQSQDDSWLPDLGMSNMFGSEPAPQMQPYPQAMAAPVAAPAPAYTPPGGGGYKVVRLPPPPPRTAGRAPAAPQLQAGIMAPNMAPQMAPQMSGGAPMPPIVSEPRHNPMQHAPVMQTHQPSIDVPLAPGVTASSKPSNVPSGLIPPESFTSGKAGYLGESRYSSRR